jgi:stringent starvation protein B
VAALKTHLLRAVYDWALQSGFTPHIVVDTNHDGVRVPPGYADDSARIILNVHPRALQGFSFDFSFDDEWIRFSARFGGTPFNIETPLAAVLAVYAKENGQGISFPPGSDPDGSGDDGAPDADNSGTARKRPSLRVVK